MEIFTSTNKKPLLILSKIAFVCFLFLIQLSYSLNTFGQNVTTFNANGTFAKPLGITSLTIETWGGGGRGLSQGASGNNGGGGGGYSRVVFTVPNAASNYAVSVGAGGTLGFGTLNGDDSYVTGALVTQAASTANGGNSGLVNGIGGTGITRNGANGGTNGGNSGGGGGGAGGATVPTNGGNGSGNVGGAAGVGGTGGGNGGAGGAGNGGAGVDGAIPGGGGGSGGGNNLANTGISGDGARGRVIITYTCTILPNNIANGFTATNVCTGTAPTATFSATPASYLPSFEITYSIYRGTYPLDGGDVLIQANNTTTLSPNGGTFQVGNSGLFGTAGSYFAIITKLKNNTGCENISSFTDDHADFTILSGSSLTCPATVNVNTNAGQCFATNVSLGTPTFSSCSGATPTASIGGNPVTSATQFQKGSTTVTWTLTGSPTNTCTQQVIVTDNQPPAITCPANITQNNTTGACSAVVTYTAPIGTDNCPGSTTTQTGGLASGVSFPVGVTTNTFRVTDAAGNTATCSFTVTVNDTQLPTITCPANISVSNSVGLCTGIATFTAPVGTDNCPSPTTTQTSGLPSGSAFPVGVTTNTYRVTDAAGNTATCSFTVTVSDTQPPTISCPANVSIANNIGLCSAVVTYTAPVGTDNCPGSTTTQTAGLASGAAFPVGVTTNTFRVTDAAGNTATCSFTVTVNDAELPTITCPTNVSASNTAGLCSAVVTYTAPIGTDNCPGSTTTQTAGLASGSAFPVGVTTNTFRVTDVAGNTATCSFTVTVSDTQPPAITCPAAITQNNTTGVCSAVVTYTAPIGTDNCPGSTTTQTGGLASGASFPVGVTTNTFRVTDAAGNTATCSFTVTVVDNQPPAITCPANITQNNTTGACSAVVTYTAPIGTDNCPGSTTTQTGGLASGASFPVGVTTNTFRVTDAAGNTATCSFTVTVVDNEVPKITACIPPATFACKVAIPSPITTIANFVTAGGAVTDNCTPQSSLLVSYSDGTITGDINCEYSFTRTYTITDAAGKSSSCGQMINVEIEDFTAPAPAGSTVACVALAVAPTLPTVKDNCGKTLTPSTPVISADPMCEGAKTYTYTYTDCEGNSHDFVYTYTIEIEDFTAPAPAGSTVACVALAVAPTLPTVKDNCGKTLTPSTPVISADPMCEGTKTYTYTYTDCEGNSHDFVYTYTIEIEDFTVPEPAGSTVSCVALAVAPTLPTVKDNCGKTLTPSTPVISADPMCEGTKTYTYTYTDCEGNSHDFVYTYTIEIEDFTAPTPAGSTVACVALAVAPTLPTVKDNCGKTLTPSTPVISADPMCEGTKTHTYTYTDCEGNSHDFVYTYTIEIEDFTAPEPAGSTVACVALAVAPPLPTVKDNCGKTLTPSTPVISADPMCEGTKTYTYTYTDCEGNSHDFVYTYTIEIEDFTAPEPAGSTVACVALAVAPTLPTVKDNCGKTLTPSTPVISADPMCEGTKTYTYTYTDCEGNSHDFVYTYTIEIEDFTVPAPAGSTVACVALAVAPTLPTVKDNCGKTLTPSTPVISADPTCEGTKTYTYTYTDCEGNSHDFVYTYTIEIEDFTAPAPAGSTVACAALAVAPTLPEVKDNCGKVLTASTPVISADPTCEGTKTYTYTYTDCKGNSHDFVYTYTIEIEDFTAPAPAGSTVACVALAVAPTLPTVKDNCGKTLTPSTPVISADPMCEGTKTYTYTYTDCEGNSHDFVYTYTIEIEDFTAPEPAGSTVACVALAVAPPLPTVKDNCGKTLTPSTPVISADPMCEGTKTYTYTYTDCEGNSHDFVYTYTIEIEDFTAPEPAGSTVACVALAVAPTLPTVKDNCGKTLTPSTPVISADPMCEGTKTYTYTYTDCEGNSHDFVYTYTIEIEDFTVPAPAGSTVACVALAVAPTLPTVKDNCGKTLTPSTPVISADPTCEGTKTYTYTYTDCEGNSHDFVYTYTIEIEDFTAPAPAGSTVACAALAVAPTLPEVKDNCGKVLTASTPVISADPTCEGTKTYTYTYTDCEGNSHDFVYTYTIEIEDFTAPAPAGSTVACVALAVAPTLPTVKDNCGKTLTPSTPVISADPMCEGTKTYTYTYTDCEGNSHDFVYTYTIEIEDFTAPEPAGSTVACVALAVAPPLPTVKDNCGKTLTPSTPVISADPMCEGTKTYTYTYTDCEGNSHDFVYTYTIEIEDFTAPEPAGSTVACVALAVAPTLPTVKDNCGKTLTPSTPVISADPMCEGTKTYTYTYTDCEGNSHDFVYTYTIEIEDFTAPEPAGSTVACVALAVAPTLPTVKDNCGKTLTPSTPVISADPTCEGTKTYTYTYTDCEGNSHDFVYTYTIEIEDFTAPAPAGSTVACAALAVAPTLPEVKDNCGKVLTASTPVISADPTCEGTKTYTYTYTDCEGNSHDFVYTYTIELEPFGNPTDDGKIVACAALAVAPTLPTVTDNCGKTLTASSPTMGGTYTDCEGTITYTYVYTDCKGNTQDWVYTYTIDDIIAPVFTSMAGSLDRSLECNDTNGLALAQALKPVANDNCQGTVSLMKTPGSFIPNTNTCTTTGKYINTWIATDCAGNTSSFTQTITIIDTTPPTIVMPTSFVNSMPPVLIVNDKVTLSTPSSGCVVVASFNKPTFSDNCTASGNLTIVVSAKDKFNNLILVADLGSTYLANFPEGANSLTYTVSDNCGNTTVKTITVTVVDDVKPNKPILPNIIACGAVSSPTTTDNCSGVISGTTSDPTNYQLAGVYFITWLFTDNAGNTVTATQQITVIGSGVVAGSVVKDLTASNSTVDGAVQNAVVAYVSIVSGTTILSTVPVNSGMYTLPDVCEGTYKMILHTTPGGSLTPQLPAGYGGFVSDGPLNGTADTTPNGIVSVTISGGALIYNNARVAAGGDVSFGLAPSALPVRLISFVGKSTEKGNELTWKASSESNFSHYEVERSVDAKAFKMIGKVNGAGNTTENLSYNFLDENQTTGMVPVANLSLISHNSSLSYYRLKMIDLDGSSEYSKVIFIENENEKSTVGNFYPNPAFGSEVSINVTSVSAKLWTITSYDLSGKIINTETRQLVKGENKLKFDSKVNQSGISIYRFESTDGVQFRKLSN